MEPAPDHDILPPGAFPPGTTSHSHWHATAGEASLRLLDGVPRKADVVIVGLGITGAALALECVQQGLAEPGGIVIVEAREAAFGASGRNGGFVLGFPGVELLDWERDLGRPATLEVIHANRRNRDLVAGFVDAHGLPSQRGGSHYIAADAAEAALLDPCLALVREAVPGATDSITETVPGPDPTLGCRTYTVAGDIGIHPAIYAAAMARSSGAGILTGTPVRPEGVTEDAAGVRVETTRGTIRARHVFLAANAYATLFFARTAGFSPTPARNQVILFKIEGERDNRLWGNAIHYHRHGYDYWRQFPDGRMLLGGGRDKDKAGEETFDLAANARVLGYLEGELAPRLTGGRQIRVLRRWSGIMGMSPDGIPAAGRAAGSERIRFAAGFSGYGLGLHRVVAERLVESALGRGDLGPFGWEAGSRRLC
jgi:glycine/D-amino acid oxidase-like deaminating enzyme